MLLGQLRFPPPPRGPTSAWRPSVTGLATFRPRALAHLLSAQVLKEEDYALAFPFFLFLPPPQLPEWVTVYDICSDNRLLGKFGAFFFFSSNVTVT